MTMTRSNSIMLVGLGAVVVIAAHGVVVWEGVTLSTKMQMRRRVVDIFPILDADQMRDFGRVIEAAVPTSDTAAARGRRIEFVIFVLRECLQSTRPPLADPRCRPEALVDAVARP